MSSLYFYQAELRPDVYNSQDKDNMKSRCQTLLNSDNSIDGTKVLEL